MKKAFVNLLSRSHRLCPVPVWLLAVFGLWSPFGMSPDGGGDSPHRDLEVAKINYTAQKNWLRAEKHLAVVFAAPCILEVPSNFSF